MMQYLPYVMCSAKGFANEFEIHTGEDHKRLPDESEFGPVGNVVIRLARDVPRNLNHIIYFDNFYTSVALVIHLAQQGIYSLGTV